MTSTVTHTLPTNQSPLPKFVSNTGIEWAIVIGEIPKTDTLKSYDFVPTFCRRMLPNESMQGGTPHWARPQPQHLRERSSLEWESNANNKPLAAPQGWTTNSKREPRAAGHIRDSCPARSLQKGSTCLVRSRARNVAGGLCLGTGRLPSHNHMEHRLGDATVVRI
jgi:hypothetical protein